MKGVVILVTGGASGIARSVALLAAERGASVVIADRDPQGALAAGTEAVERSHGKALALNVEISTPLTAAKVFAEVESKAGVPFAVYVGAGVASHTVQAAIAMLMRHGQPGSIVCECRRGSNEGAGLFVRSFGAEYAERGIRVNGLVPAAAEDVPRIRLQIERKFRPLLAYPEEASLAALWLFSDEASEVAGSLLVCEGC